MAAEDLRGDVVRCANGGVGHHAARFAPHVDLRAVADGEIYLVECDGVTVARFAWGLHELVIVRVFMLGVEACAQAEIGKFDMTAAVKKDVVGFDITSMAIVSMTSRDPHGQPSAASTSTNG